MSFDLDKEEFYETFAEIQESEGSQRALEWAWSALDWTQQELKKERVKSQSASTEERTAVVAWLRSYASKSFLTPNERFGLRVGADSIERGEHRREEEE